MIFNDGVSWDVFDRLALLIKWEAFGAKCHTLIDSHVPPDDAGFTDHDSSPVIDEETFADSICLYPCWRSSGR